MSAAVRVEPGSIDDRKGRLFLEGTVVSAGRRSGFLVTVGDDYAVLDTDASGEGLRFLLMVISDIAGPPDGPPRPVAVSHVSDMPGEGPVEVGWAFDPGRRDGVRAVLREALGGTAGRT